MSFSTVVFLIIFAVVILNIIRAAAVQKKGTAVRSNRRMWSMVAYEHNLNLFSPGSRNPFPSMRGMIDGLFVSAWGDLGPDGRPLVFCKAEFALSLPFKLCILKGNIRGEPAGQAFEISSISSEEVNVTASDAQELEKFLNSQNLNILKNCIGIYQTVKITDSFLILAAPIDDAVTFSSFLERAVSAAKQLSGGFSVTRKPDERRKVVLADDSEEIYVPGSDRNPRKPIFDFAPVVPDDDPPPEIMPQVEQKAVPQDVPEPDAFTETVSEQEPVSEPESVSEPEPEEIREGAASAEAAETLAADSVAAELFSSSFPGEKEKAYFNGIAGSSVQWSGILRSAYPYSSDFVFGPGPRVKATFEIAEVSSGYGMKNKVKATVSLPQEAAERLKGKTGKSFCFSGKLLRFEPFAREILLENGELLSFSPPIK